MTKKEMIEDMMAQCAISPEQKDKVLASASKRTKECVEGCYNSWKRSEVDASFAMCVLTKMSIKNK